MRCPHCKARCAGSGPLCPVCGRALAHPYYAREFAALARGQAPRFNAAAFLGGPFHLLYRGCPGRFARLYLPYLFTVLLLCTASLLTGTQAVWDAWRGAAAQFTWLHAAQTALQTLTCLWGVALALYNGNTFNEYYYQKRGGDAAVQGHPAAAGLLAAVWTVLVVTIAALCVGALARNLQYYAYYASMAPYAQKSLDESFLLPHL